MNPSPKAGEGDKILTQSQRIKISQEMIHSYGRRVKSLLSQIVSAGVGLWLATVFVPGVVVKLHPDSNIFGIPLTATWQLFLLFAIVLGLLNFFVKPILNIITLPLRILTLGLFGFVINLGLIFTLDYLFKELTIPWLYPLLLTSLIIWGVNFVLSIFTQPNKL